jgi:hypothetical protein
MVTSKVTSVVRINGNSTRRPPSAATSSSPILIANADASSIGILSDQRESKGLFLIANLELDLRVSPIRISKLKIPNRKFSTISPSLFHAADREPWAIFPIENARFRSCLTHTKISLLEISNCERMAVSHVAPGSDKLASRSSVFHESRVTSYESRCQSQLLRATPCSSLTTHATH